MNAFIRPLMAVLLLLGGLVASGCSLIEKVDQSLDYVNEATSYVTDAAAFAESLPYRAEQALLDPAARDELQRSFEDMKNDIIQFNDLSAPAFAENVHDKLMSYNATLLAEVNTYLEQLEKNTINLGDLQNSPMAQTLNEITGTLDQLKQLGQ
ncbi:hypothetical protein DNH61_18965 [Paenibacillus sambharensis]|uniref:Lipoprotein n=1 Tax=Paenibacillus sambharensis TaxID=1803190 RepID=A0A2W1LIS0_9BACL|nr:DUF6376 family protein [Paenibacillus sambharensis]PZD94474.1 hypothetical protein DNH61_18965 [Paenibacillus sambharensis]